jgi:hypothetical protein
MQNRCHPLLPKKDKRKVGPVYRVYSQDLFATSLHGDELGFRQEEMWRSKSRQFSKDADIIGKISESKRKPGARSLPGLRKTGFIIMRSSLWEREKDELARRLVVKLFSNRGGWIATLEEMVAEEYAVSYASDMPLLSYSVIVKDTEVVTNIRQMRRGGMSTENYSFYILGPRKTFEVFRIEGKRATLGDDFKVIRQANGTEVAEIDSKFGDIGGEFVVSIKDPVLADNNWFCRVLQCFSVTIWYRVKMRGRLEKAMKAWERGKRIPKIHRLEASLLANPRKLSLSTDEFEEV